MNYIPSFEEFLNEGVFVQPETGVFKVTDGAKKILREIFDAGFTGKNKSKLAGAAFFNSGYIGITFKPLSQGDKKFYLQISHGTVGMEDQVTGRISLSTSGNAKDQIFSVKVPYHSRSFGDVDFTESDVKEAKKLFKEFVTSK